MPTFPSHLKKYIIEQEPHKYTPIDQAVWRFVLRQLKTFLSQNAHESYVEGLKATGISIDEIPSIQNISKHLEKFGWRAAPVSGFIPPAAFLEMQARRLLPIASDMRTLDHLTYTPAPDIVHEAAGHAPMVANPHFRKYLENYAEVANKAIISKKDLELYAAIRTLSDIKEHPNSTPEQIEQAQKKLDDIAKNMGPASEASKLSRLGWWTTEYGMIGHGSPKIYGAGLLSSAGESRTAMSPQTRKIPLSLDCLNFSYDITEMQPQLFVASDFDHLNKVLFEFAETMAYKKGGIYGLQIHKESETVNTAEMNSGLQIGGKLKNFINQKDSIVYLQFEGPCQLGYKFQEVPQQGKSRHHHGFGCPVGKIKKINKCLSELSSQELLSLGLALNKSVKLEYDTGVVLEGTLISFIQKDDKNIIFTFSNCKVTYANTTLFDPAWGEYDLAVGCEIVSVYAGAPDRVAYGETEDFVATQIPSKTYNEKQKKLFTLYEKIRLLRNQLKVNNQIQKELETVLVTLSKEYPDEWLLKLEILELSYQLPEKLSSHNEIISELKSVSKKSREKEHFILEGLRIAHVMSI